MPELTSIDWLHENLNAEDLILLDASLKTTAQDEDSEHESVTIPGARYFDLKGSFSERDSPFPNMLPAEEQFELECQKLGINQTSKIVVFDNRGIYSSPRVWWMYKTMGHENVSVLNGGLPAWLEKGFPVQNIESKEYESGDFKAVFSKEAVKSYHDIVDNVKTGLFNIVDARSEGRFNGTDNEPRKHLKSGHIPNSINIPYSTVLENGKFKSESELQRLFEHKCSDEKDFVFSCGSGLTACIVLLAYEVAFKKGKYIYDGSWSEWAERQGLKETAA